MICILRLGHRIKRDERLTTHVFLTARAFGAQSGIYSGQKDREMENSIKRVAKAWGGPFEIEYVMNWRKAIKDRKGKVVHLTVYGMPIQKKIREIRRNKNLLVIVGGKKVPGEIYQLANWNVSVTSQPHSEVAALAVFLHEYFKGKELNKKFIGAKLKIVPQEMGKLIKKL